MEQIEETIHPAQQIAEVIHRVWMKGLTTASGGNITVRDKSGNIWSTPASVDKGSLKADDIVCLNSERKSGYKPTSELPFHKAVYNKRSDINALIHAHPPGLTTFSMLKSIPTTDIIPDIIRICGMPVIAPYKISGVEEIIETAEMASYRPENCMEELVSRLEHDDPSVRFWAAMGLANSGEQVTEYSSNLLEKRNDSSGEVKAALAEALLAADETSEAMELIEETLADPDNHVKLRALNLIETLDESLVTEEVKNTIRRFEDEFENQEAAAAGYIFLASERLVDKLGL